MLRDCLEAVVEKTCKACGERFVPTRQHKQFCSQECKDAYWTRTCPGCASTFIAKQASNSYCSIGCRGIASRSKPTLTCQQCGSGFVPKKADRATYCSRKCAFAARRASAARHCADCGGEIPQRTNGAFSKARRCAPCRVVMVEQRNQRLCPDCGHPIAEKGKHRCAECRESAKQRAVMVKRAHNRNRRRKRSRSHKAQVTHAARQYVYRRDEYRCHICGEPVDRNADPNSDWYPSLDHVIPKSEWPTGKRGVHHTDNLRCAHRLCNALRYTHPLDALPDVVVLGIMRRLDQRALEHVA